MRQGHSLWRFINKTGEPVPSLQKFKLIGGGLDNYDYWTISPLPVHGQEEITIEDEGISYLYVYEKYLDAFIFVES